MKNAIYTPKPGSVQEKAIQALQSGPMLPDTLAMAVGVTRGLLKYHIASPLKHGLIVPVKDAAQVRYFALGDKPYDGFKVDDLPDDPQVLHVKDPSVKPSQAAIDLANMFRPKATARGKKPVKPTDASTETKASEAPQQAPVPTTPSEDDIKAGLFSNGELVIVKETQEMRLSPQQTRKLFHYLDKITDLIGKTEEELASQ